MGALYTGVCSGRSKEIASRLSIPYDEETKTLTLTFLGTQYQITWPDFTVTHTPMIEAFIRWKI